MKAHCFNIVVGTTNCNASCPFCISKLTPNCNIDNKNVNINWRNFDKSCNYSILNGISTVLMTGKGEPTLYPNQITNYLQKLERWNFPIIELQTNGILLETKFDLYERYLKNWYELGLTTIAISIVHYDDSKNRHIFMKDRDYMDLSKLIHKLHEIGFSVRLCCTLLKGYIDSIYEVEKLINFAKDNSVEQLKLTPVGYPNIYQKEYIIEFINNNILDDSIIESFNSFLNEKGNKVLELFDDTPVYDFNGQNVCIKTCLKRDIDLKKVNSIIFFPDGHLRYSWEYNGGIIF